MSKRWKATRSFTYTTVDGREITVRADDVLSGEPSDGKVADLLADGLIRETRATPKGD